MKSLLLLLLFVPMIQGCSQQKDSTMMQKKSVEQVMKDHQDELLAIKGVQGFYQGKDEKTGDIIVVMIDSLTDKIKKAVPDSLDGYPVKIEVTGKIVPMK